MPPPPYDVHLLSDLYAHSSSDRPKIRVGLLLDSPLLSAAFASVLEDLRKASFVELAVAVYNREQEQSAPLTGPAWVRAAKIFASPRRRRQLGYALYNRLDSRLFRLEEDPLADVDCSALLASVPRLDVLPIRQRFVHRFPEEALEQLRAHRPDVLLRFGFNILRGDILKLPTYGIWSFHHGDNEFYRGGPACFWELYEQNPHSGVILQVLSENLDAGQILAKAAFASHADGLSLIRNRSQPFWGGSHFVLQTLWQLHQYGWEHVQGRIPPPTPYQGKRPLYVSPTNAEIVRWAGPAILLRAARRTKRLLSGDSIPHWQLAIRVQAAHDVLHTPPGQSPLQDFQLIESPRGHFYADPFLIEHKESPWLFFEDLDYSTNRGVLSCAQIASDGTLSPVQLALDTGSHSSYPHVFHHRGEVFMIPETLEERSVRLYRATRFPDQWKLEAELFRGPAVDTTPFFHDDRWWFFTTLVDPRSEAAGLFLFSSVELTGPWQPHPANPISFDVRFSRCGGQVFSSGGVLYRPSQNGSIHYGRSFSLNAITQLSPTMYAERPVVTVEPLPGQTGTHTYNRLINARHHIEVVDVLKLRSAAAVYAAR